MASSSLRVLGFFCLSFAVTVSCEHTSRAAPANASTAPSALAKPAPNVRLDGQSCDAFERQRQDRAEAEIQSMREKLADELKAWRVEQPACWEEYRQNADYWKSYQRDVFGSGGLGLSGIGEGGGGRGEGIGLGSIGAVGSGQGFGSGHGRLGGGHATPASTVRASTTNVQVQGVDEADIVKTDGKHVYFAVNGALRIASVTPPRLVSVTPLLGKVKELFLEGGRVVVYVALGGNGAARCTYGYECEVRGDGSRTKVVVFDVSQPAAPRVRRSFELSGALIASRRLGDTVHTVVLDGERPSADVRTWPDSWPRCGVYEAAVKAQLARLAVENEQAIRAAYALPTLTENGKSQRFCDNILRDPTEPRPAFITLYSFDLRNDQVKVSGTSVQSKPGTVYASPNALYLAVRKDSGYDDSGATEVSEIHKFRIGIRPEQTTYLASGAVRGRVLNQFAMDEWQGHLRVATTSGHLPDPRAENQVLVLAEQYGSLVQRGAVKHLAPGEDIRSVRFNADRAFVVTFKKTDPLFVLDLSEPSAPKVLGELKIPGFSTYLHPIDQTHLLSIGFAADDQGSFAYFNGLLLQLFDVSRPTEPKLLHRERIGSRGSGSEAATNHLAFNFLADEGLLAIPSTVCEGGGNGRAGDRLTFAGLLIYEVSLEKGFHQLGGINHGKAGASCNTWWSQSTSAVKRSLFLDDQVWSIAMDQAKVQQLTALGHDLARIRLN